MIIIIIIINTALRYVFRFIGSMLVTTREDCSNLSNKTSIKFGGRSNTNKIILEQLMLTPLLKTTNINELRKRAWVDLGILSDDPSVTSLSSYSGYFTVNPEYNSNLFFWFFPSKVNPSTAPLILWLNGGPGSSSLKGLFMENGPICLNSKNELIRRESSLVNCFSVLYVDSPVGAGFSFTGDPRGRAKSLEDVNRDILSLLDQFFLLFPEYQNHQFYISGESFGGKYVPSLAMTIHHRNELIQNGNKINLTGITIGSPYFHPIHQMEFAEYLYNNGLIDPRQKDEMIEEEKIMKLAFTEERWSDVLILLKKLILNDKESSFARFSGYFDISNTLLSLPNPKFAEYQSYVNLPLVRFTIHAGETDFHDFNPQIGDDFIEICYLSQRQNMMRLLDVGYQVLLYSAQLDMLCPWPTLHRVVEELDWNGKEEFNLQERRIWRVDGYVAGYIRRVRNLTFAHVLNAGHLAFVEQPRACLELIEKFIQNEEI